MVDGVKVCPGKDVLQGDYPCMATGCDDMPEINTRHDG